MLLKNTLVDLSACVKYETLQTALTGTLEWVEAAVRVARQAGKNLLLILYMAGKDTRPWH
jgi:hypothetical protein